MRDQVLLATENSQPMKSTAIRKMSIMLYDVPCHSEL